MNQQRDSTTDNEYFSLLDRLNRIPVILPMQNKQNKQTKRSLSVKQQKEQMYEDLLKENGEALL